MHILIGSRLKEWTIYWLYSKIWYISKFQLITLC